jgi:hypothetical protein
MKNTRALLDLISVGPATVRDFNELGITEVDQLIDKDASKLYHDLSQKRGQRLDPCCEDVYRAAIEQAKNPELPREQCEWFFWSRVRKGQVKAPRR